MACASGFSASPTGACIMVTTDRTTHWDCAALCGANASLACISSAEDNEFVASLVPSNPGDVPYLHHELWLGGYKASDGGGYRAEPDAPYGYKCASGQPMNSIRTAVPPAWPAKKSVSLWMSRLRRGSFSSKARSSSMASGEVRRARIDWTPVPRL